MRSLSSCIFPPIVITASLTLLCALCALSAACGNKVQLSAAAGASGTGGASASSTNATGSNGGGGLPTMSITVSTSTAGFGGAGGTLPGVGGAGGGPCNAYIDFTVDDGPPTLLTSICSESWGAGMSAMPVGYLNFPAGMSAGQENIEGCSNAGTKAIGVFISAQLPPSDPGPYTGSFDEGNTVYGDAMGLRWGQPGDPFRLDVTRFDSVAGPNAVVEGDFKALVTRAGPGQHLLHGSFRVCRVEDEQ
jgi:hypothetical protein